MRFEDFFCSPPSSSRISSASAGVASVVTMAVCPLTGRLVPAAPGAAGRFLSAAFGGGPFIESSSPAAGGGALTTGFLSAAGCGGSALAAVFFSAADGGGALAAGCFGAAATGCGVGALAGGGAAAAAGDGGALAAGCFGAAAAGGGGGALAGDGAAAAGGVDTNLEWSFSATGGGATLTCVLPATAGCVTPLIGGAPAAADDAPFTGGLLSAVAGGGTFAERFFSAPLGTGLSVIL